MWSVLKLLAKMLHGCDGCGFLPASMRLFSQATCSVGSPQFRLNVENVCTACTCVQFDLSPKATTGPLPSGAELAVCQVIMRCHCASRRCENNSRWLVIVVGIAMSTSNEANIGCHASFQRVQVSMHKISFQLVLRVRTATQVRRGGSQSQSSTTS